MMNEKKEIQARHDLKESIAIYRADRADITPVELNTLVLDVTRPIWMQKGIMKVLWGEEEVFTLGIGPNVSYPLRRAEVQVMLEQIQSILQEESTHE